MERISYKGLFKIKYNLSRFSQGLLLCVCYLSLTPGWFVRGWSRRLRRRIRTAMEAWASARSCTSYTSWTSTCPARKSSKCLRYTTVIFWMCVCVFEGIFWLYWTDSKDHSGDRLVSKGPDSKPCQQCRLVPEAAALQLDQPGQCYGHIWIISGFKTCLYGYRL